MACRESLSEIGFDPPLVGVLSDRMSDACRILVGRFYALLDFVALVGILSEALSDCLVGFFGGRTPF